MADEVRKEGCSREIKGLDAVAPDSKTHGSGRGGVEEAGCCVCCEAEEIDAVDDGHRKRDK